MDLETVCHICAGEGGSLREDTGEWMRCHTCGGSGYETTELGEAVLDLMRHHFRPMYDDMLAE